MSTKPVESQSSSSNGSKPTDKSAHAAEMSNSSSETLFTLEELFKESNVSLKRLCRRRDFETFYQELLKDNGGNVGDDVEQGAHDPVQISKTEPEPEDETTRAHKGKCNGSKK